MRKYWCRNAMVATATAAVCNCDFITSNHSFCCCFVSIQAIIMCNTQHSLWFMNITEETVDVNSIVIDATAATAAAPDFTMYTRIVNNSVNWAHYARYCRLKRHNEINNKTKIYARKCKQDILDANTAARQNGKKEMCTRALVCIDNWFDLLADKVGVHCWYTKFIGFFLNYPLFARNKCLKENSFCWMKIR